MGNTLYLYITSNPSLVKNAQTIPGISDHEMVLIDEDIKAVYHKPKPRKVLLFKSTDWNKVKEAAATLNNQILDRSAESVEANWQSFKEGITSIIDSKIPSKMKSSRHTLPWLRREERRII
jgi:hypothetical protein